MGAFCFADQPGRVHAKQIVVVAARAALDAGDGPHSRQHEEEPARGGRCPGERDGELQADVRMRFSECDAFLFSRLGTTTRKQVTLATAAASRTRARSERQSDVTASAEASTDSLIAGVSGAGSGHTECAAPPAATAAGDETDPTADAGGRGPSSAGLAPQVRGPAALRSSPRGPGCRQSTPVFFHHCDRREVSPESRGRERALLEAKLG